MPILYWDARRRSDGDYKELTENQLIFVLDGCILFSCHTIFIWPEKVQNEIVGGTSCNTGYWWWKMIRISAGCL